MRFKKTRNLIEEREHIRENTHQVIVLNRIEEIMSRLSLNVLKSVNFAELVVQVHPKSFMSLSKGSHEILRS